MAREKELPPEPVEDAPPPRRKGKMKLIMFILLPVLLLGGGVFGYLLLSDDSPAAKAEHQEKALMSLEPFLVNLADKDARRYLKVKLDLEVDSEKTAKDLEKSLPRIRDQLIFLLSSKSYPDIATPEGKLQLKKDIVARLQALPAGKKISAAYFTEFVAQ